MIKRQGLREAAGVHHRPVVRQCPKKSANRAWNRRHPELADPIQHGVCGHGARQRITLALGGAQNHSRFDHHRSIQVLPHLDECGDQTNGLQGERRHSLSRSLSILTTSKGRADRRLRLE